MTATRLGRRLDALEDARVRRMARHLTDEHGLDFEDLLAGGRRLAAEHNHLQALGLPPREFSRRMLAWIADDVGVEAGELEGEFVVELDRLRKGTTW